VVDPDASIGTFQGIRRQKRFIAGESVFEELEENKRLVDSFSFIFNRRYKTFWVECYKIVILFSIK
jgi:hypothetical protein